MSVNEAGLLCSSNSSSSVLQTTFLSRRPFYVNLLDDLGAGDFFVIDGDALLLDSLYCICRDARHGLQMLQLLYLVESFLDSLQKCLNSRFCFVFFRQHKRFWHQSPSYSLARHVLQQHLKYALGQTVHTDFTSWHCQHWVQYVEQVVVRQAGCFSCPYMSSCMFDPLYILSPELLPAGATCLSVGDRLGFCRHRIHS